MAIVVFGQAVKMDSLQRLTGVILGAFITLFNPREKAAHQVPMLIPALSPPQGMVIYVFNTI